MFSLVKRHKANLYPMTKDPNFLDSHYLQGPDGDGIFNYTIPLENQALQAAEEYLRAWDHDFPEPQGFAHAQDTIADMIFETFLNIPFGRRDEPLPETRSLPVVENFPNPFNAQTTIHLDGFQPGDPVRVSIHDLLGRLIRSFEIIAGRDEFIVWDGTDRHNSGVSSGVYFINAESSGYSVSAKTLLMK